MAHTWVRCPQKKAAQSSQRTFASARTAGVNLRVSTEAISRSSGWLSLYALEHRIPSLLAALTHFSNSTHLRRQLRVHTTERPQELHRSQMNWRLPLIAVVCGAMSSAALASATTDQAPQTGGANSTNPSNSVDNDNSINSHSNVSTIVVTLMPANTTFMPVSGGADSTNPSGSSGSAGEVVDAPIARTISPTSASSSARLVSDVAVVMYIAAWLGTQALL